MGKQNQFKLIWFIPGIIITAIFVMSMAVYAFSFTRDWDNDDPLDHVLNSKWPAEIREVMVDIAERLDDIMNGFTSGDTVTDFNLVPMNNRAADPTAVAETGILYTKDVSSIAELFYIDENGDTIQITAAGVLNQAAANVCTTAYPVGSIYISTVSTNPGTSLGCGTWAAWGSGRVIVGIDSGDSDFDVSEETGGSKTHTLTTAEMPAHTHTENVHNASGATYGFDPNSGVSGSTSASLSTGSTGGGSAHTIVQPYIVAYLWHRTS